MSGPARVSIFFIMIFIIGHVMVSFMENDHPRTTAAIAESIPESNNNEGNDMSDNNKIIKTDAEWKELLTLEQYRIARKKGTEQAYTGEYCKNEGTGIYLCVCCGNELFKSNTKYHSGSGWPSFWAPADENNINTISDRSLGMIRTEIVCSRCGAHLGHVFDDGPQPTGRHYCVNSASLKFEKADSE